MMARPEPGTDHPHRVHGMGTALEPPTWPAITPAEAAAMLARFPAAGTFQALHWHSPRPFSAAALVQTGAGGFFLKRHHRRVRTVAALTEEHRFIAHLRAAGLAVPEVVPADHGAGAVAHGGWTYELHRLAQGADLYRDRPSWTPFLTHDHAHAAGAALAKLHRAAQGFADAPRGAHPLVASFTIVPARDPLLAAQPYVGARPALAAFLAELPWRQQLARLFAALGEGLPARLAGEPPLWTHNDWHPSNLLWAPDGSVSTVIDLGLATQTCALHDIATAIERTAIPWLDLAVFPSPLPFRGGAGGGGSPDCSAPGETPHPNPSPEGEGLQRLHADPDAALALIAGYRTVLPLSRAQVETVARLLPLVHVEFALSEIDYFAGVVGDRAQAMLAWQDYLIDHADWFLSAPGRAFVQRLVGAA